MLKERKKLMSIKDFSELTGIEQSTLRYWDSIGLFRPALRHEENNYRLYTTEQIVTVNYVTSLSDLRLPLKTIDQARESRDPLKIISLLEQKEFELDRELSGLQRTHSAIHILRGMIQQGLHAQTGTVSVQHFEKMAVALGPPNQFDGDELFYRPFMEYCRQAKRSRVNLVNPIGGFHDDLACYIEKPSQPQRFFSVDPEGCDCCPAGDYLVGYVQGYYGEMGDMPRRLSAYARENGLRCEGPVYVLYLLDEICVSEPTEYLAQISVRTATDGAA